ncbi:thioredoxin O2, mitochondrial-like isoform X1 [Rhododendron vialii]|uniref:thioredoxin O2, mitochondrial-like isoform X1 n=1 Tax=Rhododendron vialii TaxID=182163 RepID=UPI0026600D1D|nr:thioredoxin O2, mitochondrial-like isoform X1 [Rhododendron vialii]
MRRNAILLRNLNRKKRLISPSINGPLINSSSNTTTAAVSNSNSMGSLKTFFSFTATFTASTTAEFELSPHFSLRRSLCSSSSSSSNIVGIDSEEKFRSSLRKVQDETLPAVFYFTAVWCGPCRLLSPVIGQLSEKYPNVTTYKIDIDQEGLGSALSELDIHSVPTLHFYKDGKKVSEVIGADLQRLKDTMEDLYK